MDLYIQVGLLFVFASMFSLLVFFYAETTALGIRTGEALERPSVNYSLDTSITTSIFYVDSRVFRQWASNARDQRSVYLMYPNYIAPSNVYEAYLYELEVGLDPNDPLYRSLKIHPKTGSITPNAFALEGDIPKMVDYISIFADAAKNNGRDGMVTIRTFTDPKTGEVIYLCYIE